MKKISKILIMKDVSGAQLAIGDKVAVQYKQLFRIGQVIGFTTKKAKVAFDFSASGDPSLCNISTEVATLSPWKLAKVVNQNVGLQDYYKYIKA